MEYARKTVMLLLGGYLALAGSVGLAAPPSGNFGGNRLSEACMDCNMKRVRRCVDEWCMDVNGVDEWYWTPLLWAAYNNCPEATKYLLTLGAKPNAQAGKAYGSVYKGTTALMAAAYYGNDEVLELLLKAGADPDLKDSEGHTAMDLAMKSPSTTTPELLRKWKAAQAK